MERIGFFKRLKGLFMMDREKQPQPPNNMAGRGGGGDYQAAWREERPRTREGGETRLTDRYSRDLTRMAASGCLDPLVGRDQEVGRVVQILSRRTKNNPALIGEPGVGKTAVAEGLAMRMASGAVPQSIRGKRLLEPGEEQQVTIRCDYEYFASWDRDFEHNGVQGGYILDSGDYYFATGNGVNDALNNILAEQGYTAENTDGYMTADGNEEKVVVYSFGRIEITKINSGEMQVELCPMGSFIERVRCGGVSPEEAAKQTRVFLSFKLAHLSNLQSVPTPSAPALHWAQRRSKAVCAWTSNPQAMGTRVQAITV